MASQVTGWAGQIEDDDGTLHALGSTAYGYCQTAAATAAKVVDMTGFKLVTGATIFVKFQYANNVANPTLNVNGTGAKPIYRYGTTRPSTNTSTNGWSAGAVLAFTYDGSGWQEHYWYNNQYTLSNQHQSNGNFAADSAIYRYQLLFHMDEDTLSPLNNADNNTGTSKTMLTTMEFDPFLPIYYYDSTTTVAANGNVAASSCHFQQGAIDLRFSFNCGDSSLTNMKNVYLKCSKQSNGKFRIASAAPLTQTLPSAADGYYYILLGRAYSGYQIGLYADKPIFYHDGTALRIYTDPAKAVPFAALTGAPTDNSALNAALAGKAAADHNHDGAYAAADHDHDERYYTGTEINTLLAGKQDTLTFDTAPTANSTNPVTSGGVKTALDGKVNKSGDTMTGQLQMNRAANGIAVVTKLTSSGRSSLPSSNEDIYSSVITDKDMNWIGLISHTLQTSGRVLFTIGAVNKPTDSTIFNTLAFGIDQNGNLSIGVSSPAAWRNGLGASNGVWPTSVGGTGGTDSGVKTLSGSAFTGTLSYQTIGKFGMVSGQIKLASNLTADYIDLQTLPAGSRPSTAISGFGGNQNYLGVIYIYTSGVIRFYKPNSVTWSSGWNLYFSFSYFVA